MVSVQKIARFVLEDRWQNCLYWTVDAAPILLVLRQLSTMVDYDAKLMFQFSETPP